VLILLTKDEAGALLAALAVGRISVRHNIGQGDANAAGVHLICDQFDMDVRRLERLCDAGNVALDVYFTQTSDPPPETAADVVSWLRVVQEALGSEREVEQTPANEA
jgi:hypothetical protein